MDASQLVLNLARWPNGEKLACRFDRDQSERKSPHAHARPGQTKSRVDSNFQLACTCEFVGPGLYLKRKDIKLFATYPDWICNPLRSAGVRLKPSTVARFPVSDKPCLPEQGRP